MKTLLVILLLLSTQVWGGTPVVVIGDHYASGQLKEFADWAVSQLAIGADAYILITFTTHMPYPVAGYTLHQSHSTPEGNIHQYMIRLAPNLHTTEIRKILAHELIHVKQIHEGRLVLHEGKHVTWNENIYKWPYWGPHDRRPWEDEANGLSLDLIYTFRKEQT